jgi:diguanylate cyclase (GGDEF)-like protein
MTTDAPNNSSLILLVDDDPAARLLMRASLENDGHQVVEAEDGRIALDRFKEHPPDIVLMDVMMPNLNGFDCCRQLRQLPEGEHTPILIITGLDDIGAIHQAFEAGATDFIFKPINWTVLNYRVKYMRRARDAFQEVVIQQNQIQELAFFDHLTGLANRALFMENLTSALDECIAKETLLGLLFLDLDRFKNINDTLGHHSGDLLLKGVADRISACIRESDPFCRLPGRYAKNYVSRLGGDEFTVLLPHLHEPENAGQVAQRINKRLSEPFIVAGTEVFISVSIGIAIAPLDTNNVEELMMNADLAMYHAKEMGKNHYQYFKQDLNIKARQRLEFENDIRRALAAEEFEMFYQPQVDLSNGQIIGAEALARWHHAERGWVSPGEFIPVIEELGLIVPFTNWVIRRVVNHQLGWQRINLPNTHVAVNVSSKQFIEQDIPTTVADTVEQFGLRPDWLELEMTESVLAQQNEETLEALRQIRALGMKISVDDFGTGYSSLAYLKVFPIDIVKIDRFFIKDLLTRKQDTAIVKAIIALASSLQIKIIAEGIETIEQFKELQRMGADYGQGFLFSEAVNAECFARMLAEEQILIPGSGPDRPAVAPRPA